MLSRLASTLATAKSSACDIRFGDSGEKRLALDEDGVEVDAVLSDVLGDEISMWSRALEMRFVDSKGSPLETRAEEEEEGMLVEVLVMGLLDICEMKMGRPKVSLLMVSAVESAISGGAELYVLTCS